jgi:hypothetical protein
MACWRSQLSRRSSRRRSGLSLTWRSPHSDPNSALSGSASASPPWGGLPERSPCLKRRPGQNVVRSSFGLSQGNNATISAPARGELMRLPDWRPTIATLIAGIIVCGCASNSAEHPSKAKAAVASPAAGAAAVSGTANPVTAAGVASNAAVGSNAAASSSTAVAANATVASKAADPTADAKVTCHMEIPTGSRVGLRVCETAAQREAREAEMRATKDMLNRPASGCPQLGPGGCAGGGG